MDSRSTFWKLQNIEEEEKEEEEEEKLSEVLLLASEKYCRTMEALNADPNLNDDERKKVDEKDPRGIYESYL
jgi:hypothetical protein